MEALYGGAFGRTVWVFATGLCVFIIWYKNVPVIVQIGKCRCPRVGGLALGSLLFVLIRSRILFE